MKRNPTVEGHFVLVNFFDGEADLVRAEKHARAAVALKPKDLIGSADPRNCPPQERRDEGATGWSLGNLEDRCGCRGYRHSARIESGPFGGFRSLPGLGR